MNLRVWKLPFWQQAVLALVLGAGVGAVIRPVFGDEAATDWLKPIGDVYVSLLKLVVVPLVFTAIVVSVGRLRNVGNVARLTLKTLGWFVITSAIAVAIGLATALILKPGTGVGKLAVETTEPETVTWVQVLKNLAPSNIVKAMAEGNVLGVVVFAAILGAALVAVGERGARLTALFEDFYAVMGKIVWWVVRLTPIGSFFLMAWVVGTYGPESLAPLAKFIVAIYIAGALMLLVGYPVLLRVFGRVSPVKFFRNSWPAMQFAFVSASSLGTLPITQRVTVERNGVDRSYASFAVPLGATIKFDGCGAIYPAVAAVFIAQYQGIELGLGQYLLIALAAVIGQLGTGGTPGPAIVALTLTLTTAGLPLEAIGYLIAIDRVIDMMRTMVNVTGQAVVPVLVARSDGLLDDAIFNAPPKALDEAPADTLDTPAGDAGQESGTKRKEPALA
ncbi:dicarboxylate/amino acid:cation symporter [Bailinhaonella thermotolerans]|uniref:Dicarboxylate/amino acid:cation symporter n=1 Tax=Bailinhaonella thermotolerans TaxID=1070861 RepID=A0A3A4AZJ3_9ACTN|nr:dicarboxylate/amino acid:cation symporter [Bailinhaonella thermotolerans]RJL31263.1 dicarboxylate/amino acid:cation symporter [Bailinhaonella thermotolerans]